MGESKPLPQLAIGLAISIEEDESLVHDGQLVVDDFLDAMDAFILIAHDVIGELVVLLDFLVVSYDLVNLHLPNPFL